MAMRNILLILIGLLLIGGGMWWDAAYEFPIELLGDLTAALGGVAIAIGFATARVRPK